MAFIESIQEISMEGFQVVSSDMFQRPHRLSVPTATLWPNSICFSKASLVTLNNCERIRIEVNTAKRCILVVPVTEMDKDSIRWTKNTKTPTVRKIECSVFARRLYETWGWNNDLAYRAIGRIVSVDRKVMLLFDFSNPESWKYRGKVKAE